MTRAFDLAVFDLDGTLNDTVNPKLMRYRYSEELPNILKKVQTQTTIAILTGRDATYVDHFLRDICLEATIFAENGCHLVDKVKGINENYGGWMGQEKSDIEWKIMKNGLNEGMSFDENKLFMISMYFILPPKNLEDAIKKRYEQVRNLFANSPSVAVTYSSVAVDIVPAGIDKGYALDTYCEQNGIDPSKMIMVGDSANDLPALLYVAKRGGLVGVVSKTKELRVALEDYPRVYFSEATGTEGTVEFLKAKI